MKSADHLIMFGTRITASVAKRLVDRAQQDRRSVSSMIAVLIETGLDCPSTSTSELAGVEREFLIVLDQAVATHGVEMDDHRRVCGHAEFRTLYMTSHDTANVYINTTRRLLEARKIIAYNDTHIWRL